MRWLIDVSLQWKITLILVIVIAGAGAIYFVSDSLIEDIDANMTELVEWEMEAAIRIMDLKAELNSTRGHLLELFIQTDEVSRRKVEKQLEQNKNRIYDRLNQLEAKIGDEPALMTMLVDLKQYIEQYLSNQQQEITLMQAGRMQEAEEMGRTVQAEIFKAMMADTEQLLMHLKNDVITQQRELQSTIERSSAIFALLVLLLILIAIVSLYFVNRYVIIPMRSLTGNANEISEGNLRIQLDAIERNDEIGNLWNAFAHMLNSLKEVAAIAERVSQNDLRVNITPKSDNDVLSISLNKMVDNLMNFSGKLREVAGILNTSAQSVLSSTSDLASSASETATSMTETTATVEEAKQASHLSNKKAREVSERAQASVDISDKGRENFRNTIQGINRIGREMDTIADNVIKLSEQSKAIGEIISTVNDLAEQSNLLAVNASIEAARAGEHGKSFGVVAQEIKHLADQSKESTGQIRSILNDIQSSISTVVLSTEQGTKSVQSGVALVNEANEAMEELSDSINLAAEAGIQIAASSHQQEIGMTQIAAAMENIKTASTHNASATKELQDLARKLREANETLNTMLESVRSS